MSRLNSKSSRGLEIAARCGLQSSKASAPSPSSLDGRHKRGIAEGAVDTDVTGAIAET